MRQFKTTTVNYKDRESHSGSETVQIPELISRVKNSIVFYNALTQIVFDELG